MPARPRARSYRLFSFLAEHPSSLAALPRDSPAPSSSMAARRTSDTSPESAGELSKNSYETEPDCASLNASFRVSLRAALGFNPSGYRAMICAQASRAGFSPPEITNAVAYISRTISPYGPISDLSLIS